MISPCLSKIYPPQAISFFFGKRSDLPHIPTINLAFPGGGRGTALAVDEASFDFQTAIAPARFHLGIVEISPCVSKIHPPQAISFFCGKRSDLPHIPTVNLAFPGWGRGTALAVDEASLHFLR